MARTPPPGDAARRVLLAGATGLIGRALLAELQSERPPPAIDALVRRRPADADARVHWRVVDFGALPALPAADDAYCCLGTTIAVAGSQAAFRAVDFDAVLAFARAARASGVRRFAVVSALGASPRSPTFYNRVKGEMEQAVSALGFDSLVIARPSLLVGDRDALGQPARLGERLAIAATGPVRGLIPKAWRPIDAKTVARAMIRALNEGRPGVRIVESAELQNLGG